MFWSKPEVKIIKEIDTAEQWWCSAAVLFSVKNGRNTSRNRFGPLDKKLLKIKQRSLFHVDYPYIAV